MRVLLKVFWVASAVALAMILAFAIIVATAAVRERPPLPVFEPLPPPPPELIELHQQVLTPIKIDVNRSLKSDRLKSKPRIWALKRMYA